MNAIAAPIATELLFTSGGAAQEIHPLGTGPFTSWNEYLSSDIANCPLTQCSLRQSGNCDDEADADLNI
jgi:hypothetical protein